MVVDVDVLAEAALSGIHLASAIAVGADSILTYDKRLAGAAAAIGLPVLSPAA